MLTPNRPGRGLRITLWSGVAAGLIALSLLIRVPSFIDAPLDRDEGAYALIAQQWAQGATLYGDYFDHKPPLVYIAYRSVFWFAGDHLAAVRRLFAIASGLAAWACAGSVWILCGRRWLPALLTGVVACVFLNAPLLQGEAANTETLMVLGTACAAWCICRDNDRTSALDAGLAGLCMGLACLAKPVAGCEAAYFTGWLATHAGRRRSGQLVAFGVGLAMPAGVWLLVTLGYGTLRASFDAVLLYNLRYAGGAIPLWARLAAIPLDYGVPLALLWTGLGGCTLTALRTQPRAANFALGWSAAAIAGVLAGGRLYPHYYQELVPPLAVALGVTSAALLSQLRARAAFTAGVAGLALGLWPPLASAWRFAMHGAVQARDDWQPRLAAVLSDLTEPSDTILVWGAEPYLYFAAGRRPPTRFVYKYPLLGDSVAGKAAREELLVAAAAHPPAVLVAVKHDISPETPRESAEEISDLQSPFHQLGHGLSKVLDSGDFTLYARPDRAAQPWSERWAGGGSSTRPTIGR